jgi:hypothetical protein
MTTTSAPELSIEEGRMVAEEMERWLSDLEGFEGFLLLASEDNGIGIAIAFWTSREVAERYSALRAQFRGRILSLAGVEIEDVVGYELAFARLGPGLLAAARG